MPCHRFLLGGLMPVVPPNSKAKPRTKQAQKRSRSSNPQFNNGMRLRSTAVVYLRRRSEASSKVRRPLHCGIKRGFKGRLYFAELGFA